MQQNGARAKESVEVCLVVQMSREAGWRASVVGPDATAREFVSPFELARFLAWPLGPRVALPNNGIR